MKFESKFVTPNKDSNRPELITKTGSTNASAKNAKVLCQILRPSKNLAPKKYRRLIKASKIISNPAVDARFELVFEKSDFVILKSNLFCLS